MIFRLEILFVRLVDLVFMTFALGTGVATTVTDFFAFTLLVRTSIGVKSSSVVSPVGEVRVGGSLMLGTLSTVSLIVICFVVTSSTVIVVEDTFLAAAFLAFFLVGSASPDVAVVAAFFTGGFLILFLGGSTSLDASPSGLSVSDVSLGTSMTSSIFLFKGIFSFFGVVLFCSTAFFFGVASLFGATVILGVGFFFGDVFVAGGGDCAKDAGTIIVVGAL